MIGEKQVSAYLQAFYDLQDACYALTPKAGSEVTVSVSLVDTWYARNQKNVTPLGLQKTLTVPDGTTLGQALDQL